MMTMMMMMMTMMIQSLIYLYKFIRIFIHMIIHPLHQSIHQSIPPLIRTRDVLFNFYQSSVERRFYLLCLSRYLSDVLLSLLVKYVVVVVVVVVVVAVVAWRGSCLKHNGNKHPPTDWSQLNRHFKSQTSLTPSIGPPSSFNLLFFHFSSIHLSCIRWSHGPFIQPLIPFHLLHFLSQYYFPSHSSPHQHQQQNGVYLGPTTPPTHNPTPHPTSPHTPSRGRISEQFAGMMDKDFHCLRVD